MFRVSLLNGAIVGSCLVDLTRKHLKTKFFICWLRDGLVFFKFTIHVLDILNLYEFFKCYFLMLMTYCLLAP